MKVGIITDIHNNLMALKAVVAGKIHKDLQLGFWKYRQEPAIL